MKLNWAAAALGVVLASIATAQVAILQIQVIEGEGGIYSPGGRTNRPLVVEVTDETGRPVAGAAVNFHLTEDGPSGTFGNGLRTDVVLTDERGRATLRAMQVNRTPGRFEIRITASKEQTTAGLVSFQYIVDPSTGTAPVGAGNTGANSTLRAPVSSSGHSHKKLVIILAAVGVGAAAGVLAAHSGSSGPAAAATPTNATSPIPPSIGTPTITVGKP